MSKIGSGRGLTAFWTADEGTHTVKVAVVYDEDLYAHPKEMFDAHSLSELCVLWRLQDMCDIINPILLE